MSRKAIMLVGVLLLFTLGAIAQELGVASPLE